MLHYDTRHVQNKHPGGKSKAITERKGWKRNHQNILNITDKHKLGLNTRHFPQRKGQTKLRHRGGHPSSTDDLHAYDYQRPLYPVQDVTHITSQSASKKV